ncbi:MAG TPA: diacylglycerol kinase family protein [Chitinophagaceae bacterium]
MTSKSEYITMPSEKFSLAKRAISFKYAFAGIRRFFATEHNAWIHLASTAGVIVLTVAYGISAVEAVLLIFAIGFVWTAEIINTCIEKIMDFISTETHPQIQLIKDMAAGAVLIAAATALITGLIIFIPKIF